MIPTYPLRGTMAGPNTRTFGTTTAERPHHLPKDAIRSIDITSGDTVKINDLKSVKPTIAGEDALVTAVSLLAQSGVAELRFLRVDENDSEIRLTGRVRSYYHKQLAQETIRSVVAGRQVINRVDVRSL